MSSYRSGQPTGLTISRSAGNILLGARHAVAGFTNRHVNTVRRYCLPVACDVGTRAELYDLDAAVRQFKSMRDERFCCIRIGGDPECGSPTMRNAPLPICAFHASQIAGFFEKQDKLSYVYESLLREQAAAPSPRGPLNAPRAAVIYYVLMGGAIKIGTTVDLKKRLESYGPMADLLVTEPGGHQLERQRHREFNEYLCKGREWFEPGPRLREHIEKLMSRAAA